MRKEENVNGWKERSMETNEPPAMDETDLLIMQTLSDELSDITVSEDLITRTLRAAGKHRSAGEDRGEEEQKGAGKNGQEKQQGSGEENRREKERESVRTNREEKERRNGGEKKRKARVYRLWGGALTAAAALLIVVLGAGSMRFGSRDKSDESGSASNESMLNGVDRAPAEQAGSMEDNAAGEPEGIPHEGTKDEWEEISGGGNLYETNEFFSDGFADNGIPDWSEPEAADMTEGAGESSAASEPFPENGEKQEIADGAVPDDGIWLYHKLLAAFDDTAGEAPAEADEQIKGEARSILWQNSGAALSCVIYHEQENYRVAAVLEENGVRRRILLENWTYARELWELAGEGER